MPSAVDITGNRFGRLVAIRSLGSRNGSRLWECRCDCGSIVRVFAGRLRYGNTKSCGCLQSDVARRNSTKHGATNTVENTAWRRIKQRCTNPKNKSWRDYGGRGISICERWMTFENFLADMGRRPSARHSIDRIDNDGDYEPGNCRWATRTEQNRNSRNCKLTESAVREVLVRVRNGATSKSEATRLGVSVSLISKIRIGALWSEVVGQRKKQTRRRT